MKCGWDEVVRFHGHVCPGLAVGYRAAAEVLARLGAEAAVDEELVAIVENDACGVDALQMLTGCTLGKGNLIYRDYGKPVYTVGNRRTGKAVRVVMRRLEWPGKERLAQLRTRSRSEQLQHVERQEMDRLEQEYMQAILTAPAVEFLDVQTVQLDLPTTARIFSSVECSACGESAMEPRVRTREGLPVCLACWSDYTRGWGRSESGVGG